MERHFIGVYACRAQWKKISIQFTAWIVYTCMYMGKMVCSFVIWILYMLCGNHVGNSIRMDAILTNVD